MTKFIKRSFIYGTLLTLFSVYIISCCKPGLGGNVTLIAYPTHHGSKVKWDTILVKYNGTTFQGLSPSNYDHMFLGKPNDTTVVCDGLGCGQYYFFAKGYDSLRQLYVTGGISVTIAHKDRNETKLQNIAVTE
jgi:hypothetical protein